MLRVPSESGIWGFMRLGQQGPSRSVSSPRLGISTIVTHSILGGKKTWRTMDRSDPFRGR